jgi:hypothetical protein
VIPLLFAAALAAGIEVPSRPANQVHEGNLSEGEVLTDLGWAQNAAIACMPSTRWKYIQGKTVFFDAAVPAGKTAHIRVRPTGNQDVAMYVLVNPKVGGATKKGARPPNVDSALACQKSYWGKPGEAEQVEIGPRPAPQTLVIAVAGAKDVLDGGFTLEVWVGD